MFTIPERGNTFMKKRITFLTAIVLCVAMMISFASCSAMTGEEEESTEFVAATVPVTDDVPVSEAEIIAFYNDILTKLQKADMFDETNKPGINLNESFSVDNIKLLALDNNGEATESDALATLNKSAKAIKDRMLGGIKTDSAVIAFGDMATPVSTLFYPYDGTTQLTAEDVIKADCNVDGSKMNIAITLAGDVNTVNNVFGTRDKAAVLSAINEQSKAYANVKDYAVEYIADEENNTYSTINLTVEVANNGDGTYSCTGRIMSLEIKVICDVAADMTCAGSFAQYGDVQVQFRFTDRKYYEFDWIGNATWEPMATEEVSE